MLSQQGELDTVRAVINHMEFQAFPWTSWSLDLGPGFLNCVFKKFTAKKKRLEWERAKA